MTTGKSESVGSESEGFVSLLAASALHPRLRSLLLFDATPEQVESAAEALAVFLASATGEPVETVWLAWHYDEDALWGVGENLGSEWSRPGILTQSEGDSAWRLLVVPDLPHLNLAAQRACVQTANADPVSLERYGQSRHWRPRLLWLAACPQSAVGEVSPHLLDRFSLRWTCRSESRRNPVVMLRDQLESRQKTQWQQLDSWKERLRSLGASMPRMTEPALHRVEQSMAAVVAPGVRSHLTLARLSVALAWLEGASEVDVSRVDSAVQLLNLEPAVPSSQPEPESEQDRQQPQETGEASPQQERDAVDQETGRDSHQTRQEGESVVAQVGEDDRDAEPAIVPDVETGLDVVGMSGPWPELEARTEREFGSLQLPIARAGRQAEGHGMAVGVRPTSDLREIALLPTLFAAAAFQEGRKKKPSPGGEDRRWILEEMDLRAWRRAPTAREILVLLLDTTSYGRSDWPTALVPYLRQAYIARAAVCVVLVGAEGTEDELRAERILVRSVLVPEFQDALDRDPGRATPLADGLQLALDTLRKALQHGRSAVQRAQLVVLSDGRGNVPLAVSRGEPMSGPVGRRGVEDALVVGKELARIKDVDIDLLDPQPRYGGHLTRALAGALGARIVPIPRLAPQEKTA